MSLAQANILTAIDRNSGQQLLIKLLRIPETMISQSTKAKKDAISAEIEACNLIADAEIPGLVKCDVVQVSVNDSRGLNIAHGVWAALKMKRYLSSLTDIAQLSETLVYRGFSLILNALKEMHNLKLVHMDVKSDNIFVNENSMWHLGDFGSTRKIGEAVWSFTDVFNPYDIPGSATAIPAMDFVLLCVTVAVELHKDTWKDMCGTKRKVEVKLVLDRLKSIEDVAFKNEVVELFESNVRIVEDHLKASHQETT